MTLTAADVWRDYAVSGVPASGANQPDKRDVRSWAAVLESAVNDTLSSAGFGATSKSVLLADLAHAAGSLATVRGDATSANNGVYIKSGTSGSGTWTRIADLPDSLVQMTVTGGTANAILASLAPQAPSTPGGKLYLLVPTANNTGAVTINGTALKTQFGDALVANALLNDVPYLLYYSVDSYRMLLGSPTDSDSVLASVLAAQASAEAARDDSETARDASIAGAGESLLTFPTRNSMAAANVIAGVKSVMARARNAFDDLGAAGFVRALSEPWHKGKIRTIDRYLPNGSIDATDGGWWESQGFLPNPYWFDGTPDSSDNYDALQEMITYTEQKNCVASIPAQTFKCLGNLRTEATLQSDYDAASHNGFRIMGMGRRSIIQGPYDASPTAADYSTSNDASMGAQAGLSIYRSNITVEGLAFHGFKVGLFLGQDPTTDDCSVVSNNIIRDIWGERNGTVLLMQPGVKVPTSGIGQLYYNKLSNFHFIDYGIGVHMAPWIWGVNNGAPNTGNNNRNTLTGFRGARGWCNYLIESGDGNGFFDCYSENGAYSTDSASFVGASPSQLTPFVSATTGVAWIFAGEAASNNWVVGGRIEAVDSHIIDAGFKNHLKTNADPAKCNFTVGTKSWRGPREIEGENRFDNLLVGVGTGEGARLLFQGFGSTSATIGTVSAGQVATSAASVTVTGARVGDQIVSVSSSNDTVTRLTGRVTADDTVSITATNASSASETLASATISVEVKRYG